MGIDIGYREHVAAAISKSTFLKGAVRWKKAKAIHFSSSRGGLDKLHQYLLSFSSDPKVFLILCEPTGGHYGVSLYQDLLKSKYSPMLVDNSTTRHMREKIFGSLPKTDEMDARVMARIAYLHDVVGEEFTLKVLRLPDPDQEELLALCRNNWKLNGMVTRVRNQFAQLMAVVFPELKFFFEGSVSSPIPIRLMASYPSPAEIANAMPEELYNFLWKARSYQHAKRVQELQNLARNSSGSLPDPGRAWRLAWMSQFLLSNFELLSQLDKQIEQVCNNHPNYTLLMDIPYSGPNTLGTICLSPGIVLASRIIASMLLTPAISLAWRDRRRLTILACPVAETEISNEPISRSWLPWSGLITEKTSTRTFTNARWLKVEPGM